MPGFRVHSSVEAFITRNLTPPYVSHIADVRHIALDKEKDYRLIMCSDGLTDLYAGRKDLGVLKDWFDMLGETSSAGNRALTLLRDGLGGDNLDKVSQFLTVECPEKWLDDITVLVQELT